MSKRKTTEFLYGRTDEGQLLYDIAFTNLSSTYLARKHRRPVANIRLLRNDSAVKKLRRQNRLPAVVELGGQK